MKKAPAGKAAVQKKIDALMGRLKTKAEDGMARTILQGRAVSKNGENLHLAIPTGVVSIPISEIEEIQTLPARDKDPTLIAVQVRDVASIKSIYSRFPLTPDPLPGWEPPIIWPPKIPTIDPFTGGGNVGLQTFKFIATDSETTDTSSNNSTDDAITSRTLDDQAD